MKKFFSSFVVGASLLASLTATLAQPSAQTPCLANALNNLELEGCSPRTLFRQLRAVFDDLPSCNWGFPIELMLLTGTDSIGGVEDYFRTLCMGAIEQVLDEAPLETWESIHPDFTQSFLETYAGGGTYLNLETGNFQNPDDSDPRATTGTSDESYFAGIAIDAFYHDGATSHILEDVDHLSQCQNQAIMCCFGRDRQFGDQNGRCRPNACDDAPPGDNTNLCFDPVSETPYPYDEKIHCHGFLWGEDESDPSNALKFNNFFYVLMHDHMYTRGYVESVEEGIPMCDCIENMPVVLRADCSEVSLEETSFALSYSTTGGLSIAGGPLQARFRSCRGVYPDPTSDEYVPKGNDLASKAYAMFLHGQLDLETRNNIFYHLAGHAEPKHPENKVNEESCELAWDDETQGQDYYAVR